MKRKDFFKSLGALIIAPAVIPSLFGKDPEIIPVRELANPKGIAIDMNALDKITNHLSPLEILRIYNQTGNIIYKTNGKQQKIR